MHLFKIAFKLYAFVYNYIFQRITTRGWPNCNAPIGSPLVADPVDEYTKMSRKKHLFEQLYNCIIGYDVSVKLARKPLNTVEIDCPKFH